MKLLDPRTIQSNLNFERKKDIDQGVILASKVDALREKLSQEEQKLRIFEDFTKKEVLESINLKIKERDALEEENIKLRKIREALIVPLDKEWLRVKEQSSIIELSKEETKTLKLHLEKQNAEVEKQLKKIAEEQSRQQERGKEVKKKEELAQDTLLEAQKRLSDARKEEKRVNLQTKKKGVELSEKEQVLQSTVNEIARKERDLKDKEKQLLDKERQLNDRYATLLRTEARIK